MPCKKCGNTKIGHGIAYCNCRFCNECHVGGFCPDGKTCWFQKGKPGTQLKRYLNQSHGGHGFIPIPKCACSSCDKDACKKKHQGGHFSHCGNTCRHQRCGHR